MVPLREAVRLVADRLAEPQPRVVARQPDRLALALHEDELLLLREADDHRRLRPELRERLERRVQLPQPAVDQDDVGEELRARARLAVAAAHRLADRAVVVVPGGLDAVAAVGVLERPPVDEAHLAGHGLAAAEVGDVDRLHAADRPVQAQRARQAARPHLRVAREHRDLRLPVVLLAGARLAVVQLGERVQLVAQDRGVLEAPVRGGLLHLRLQLARQHAPLGAEESQEAVHVAAVALARHAVGARRGALADRVKEAWPEAAVGRVVGLDVELAGAVLEDALQQGHRGAQRMHAGERPEHARPLEPRVGRIAGDVDPGELVADRDGEVREGLVVAEQLVEPRVDVLHQPALEEQRLPLGLAFQDLEIRDHVQHGLLAGAQVGTGDEVAPHPVGQAGGFPHVQDLPLGVLHQVDAGDLGQGPGLVGQPAQAVGPWFSGHSGKSYGAWARFSRILPDRACWPTNHPLRRPHR